MGWPILVLSAVFEAVWATALGESHGFTRPVPTVVFAVALALSMIGLAVATRRIPIGVAYAVWIGIGAALTVGFAMVTGAEAATVGKVTFLVGIVGCVIGLKFAKAPAGHARSGEVDRNLASPVRMR
ncbi:multidrug efflux SMR transporter [Nocardia puris]|uniref:Quaternary ammonium compound-resistance protein SugE n=1 Tax=Nocardia puris TaxID=208602 RepID=A0A366DY21_9NOCA|nr:multidrug efflux SMR transporter [Nocardia puris]MBF6210078.1 multidrug efflux SMR transporter [Nocardia puris]MBF6368269.1 multidrug efflux SMR transporter [Nocardia puris]MBF6458012.1 multidrug efflux SMR transporter [Nocardia puris]RBO94174.1 quaternary ammonium compound-resistance protein SugE [Nocardia puris]